MATDSLEVLGIPKLSDATMLLALTGWMDGDLLDGHRQGDDRRA